MLSSAPDRLAALTDRFATTRDVDKRLTTSKNRADVAALESRSAVLVTGMSGTGKSTALAQLGRRGHRIVDTDDPGWIVRVEAPHGIEPLWNLERVGALLDRHRAGWLFVSGCVANQAALYDRFDEVVLLSAPVDVILAPRRRPS